MGIEYLSVDNFICFNWHIIDIEAYTTKHEIP